MGITTVGTANPNITQIGAQLTATTWGGSSGGFRVVCNGGAYTEFDTSFTGFTAVSLGAYYGTTGQIQATLYDSTNTTILSGPVSPTLGSGFQDTPVSLFTGLSAGTTYCIRITAQGNGNQLLCSVNFLQFTYTSTPGTLSLCPGYGTVCVFSSSFSDGVNITPHVGLEGGIRTVNTNGWTSLQNTCAAQGSVTRNPLLRIPATIGALWIYEYQSGQTWHLNRVPISGTSGTPLDAGYTYTSGSGGNTTGWHQIASGLDTSTEYIWELSGNAQTSNVLLYGIMTTGGTGVDTGVTGSTLVRPIRFAITGDSRAAADNGTNNQPVNGAWALMSQALNCQVQNIAIPGESLSVYSGLNGYQDLAACGVPLNIIIDMGINDIKAGSPPTPTQLSGYMITLINKIRTISGFSAVPIYVEAIKPYNGMTYAAIEAYNSGANGYQNAVVAAYNAGTAASQSPSPDPNVHYLNASSWNLAGASYVAGGTFVTTNFDDGLHLNSATALSNPGPGYSVEKSFLIQTFGNPATGLTLTASVPPSGAPGATSPPFTVAASPASPVIPGTVIVTPASTQAGDVITPSTISLTTASPSGTFEVTGSSTLGARSISLTNNGGLTNPSPVTYTVASEIITDTITSILFALTGQNTNWTGSPFSLVSGGGSIAAQSVSSTTAATITITTSGNAGPWVISDGTSTFSLAQSGGTGGGGRSSMGLGI